jgi:F-type H+-transporting ATPase subunit epsilon
MMTLEVCTPNSILLECAVTKVVAPGLHGSFCILPRHVDIGAIVGPGIIVFDSHQRERYVAVDEGVLTKKNDKVTVVAFRALEGKSLESLADELSDYLVTRDQGERRTRAALAGLESHITRGLFERDRDHGR